MWRTLHISLLLWGVCIGLCGQTAYVIPSSNTIANIQTPRTDTWTAFHNPASLVQTDSWQVAMQYENRYMLAELNTAMLQAAYCNRYLNVGVSYSFFGYSKYQEMMAGLTLARSFGNFSIGLQEDFVILYCGDVLKYHFTGITQVGTTINITPKLVLGIHSFNTFWQKIKVEDEVQQEVPIIYSLGLDYHFSNTMRWAIQGDYDVCSTYRIATSLEWQAIDLLVVKIGAYYHDQFVGCMGLAITWDKLRIDTNFELNPTLGVTCQARVSYRWACAK